MNVSRRNFLKGAAAGTAGTALTAGVLAGGARADGGTGHGSPAAASYPFHRTRDGGDWYGRALLACPRAPRKAGMTAAGRMAVR